MTIELIDIIKAGLKSLGLAGLCDPDAECGCDLDDLCPCEEPDLIECIGAERRDDGLMWPKTSKPPAD